MKSTSNNIHSKHSDLIAQLSSAGTNRRPIRILHNSALLPQNHEVFRQLEETNGMLEERMISLKTLRSHTKQTNKANLLKGEWIDEYNRLNGLRSKIENGTKSYLQLMIVNSNQLSTNVAMQNTTANNSLPGHGQVGTVTAKLMKTGLGSSVNPNSQGSSPESRQDITFIINFIDSIIYEEEKLISDRLSLRSSYQSQLKEIKHIINGAMKSSQNSTVRESGGVQDNTQQHQTVIRGVIAELFLNLRSDHSNLWQALRQQEDELKTQLGCIDKKIQDVLKAETLQKQDEFLEAQLVKLLKECSQLSQQSVATENALSPQMTPRSPRFSHSPRSKNISKDSCSSTSICISDGETSMPNLEFNNSNDIETRILQSDPELATIIQSYFHQIQTLDLNLSRLKEQSSVEVSQLHADLELDPNSSLGGWETESHDLFLKIYRKATLTGMQRKKMMEILVNSLPNITRDHLMTHEEYVRGMKRISSKYKQLEQEHIVKRQEIMIQLAKEVQDYNNEKAEKLRYEQQLQQHEEKRMIIHERLESLRREKQILDEEKRIEELLRAQEEDQQQVQRLQQMEAERQERNKRLAEYREQKRILLEKQSMTMELERKRMAEDLKKLIEENRSKVEFRAHKIEEKNLQRKLKEVTFN